jgi:hypothetical protein
MWHKVILIFIQSTCSSCLILIKLDCSRQIFEKRSSIKFHANPSNVNRVAPRGRTDWQTGMTKLKVAFPNFPNAPSISRSFHFTFRAFSTTSIVSIDKLPIKPPFDRRWSGFPLTPEFRSVMWSVRNTCCINVTTRYCLPGPWCSHTNTHSSWLILTTNW